MTTFDCTDIKATLSGLIDDQVDEQTRHLAERHLAECEACRALVGRAEGLNDLIAMDASLMAPQRVSDEFVHSVLSRTVYARMYEHAGRSWTNWLGWVAAAACLSLAVTIWMLERQRMARDTGTRQGNELAQAGEYNPTQRTMRDGSALRSFTYNHPLQPAVFAASKRTVIESEEMLDDALRRQIDEQLALVQPVELPVERLALEAELSEADSDTLHAAARLLDMIADSDASSFADIEQARRIAVYDELPQRLADVRIRLNPSQRAQVLAAESIILRLINGPIDASDLHLMQDTVSSLNLASRIGAISGGRDAITSM